MDFLTEIQAAVRNDGIDDAIAHRDTPKIFDWLLTTFSYQGVSDQVARTYIRQNGSASWSAMENSLLAAPTCPRLRNYWNYESCRYDKTSYTCSEAEHIGACPVPRPHLRNGRLNQTAYSFFLFVRDIADSDLVGWIDKQLAAAPEPRNRDEVGGNAQEQLLGPLRNVYGVSDKILTMTLSGLLLGASAGRPAWFETGKRMIAIDTLVHNFFHRTGTLDDCGSAHTYGVSCYAAGGCAEIIEAVSKIIDARAFNRSFPQVFPRFVQHAIWRYCAADGLDLCNGNRIDDRFACQISYCQLFPKCRLKPLKIH
jgi:hypothetical protein